MTLLAIETTCDETAAAVIDRSRRVLSNVVASQSALHARWRGVVPEVASRAHVERIIPVIDEAVQQAGIERSAIEAVAVAVRPGLVGSLLVGLSTAKGIAAALDVPLVGYDHLAAHLYACRLSHGEPLPMPLVGLVVSGGHTSLSLMRSPLDMERLGGTIDDAAGEAFDKAASLLGLGYPGGPEIARVARRGDGRRYRLPRPLANDDRRLDFSFSGLKTALRYLVQPPGAAVRPPPSGQKQADLAAAFQQAVVDCLMAKLDLAILRTGCQSVAIGGGVTANLLLRDTIDRWSRARHIQVFMPPPHLCTDNAAMGAIAWERLERGDVDSLALNVRPGVERYSQLRQPPPATDVSP